VQINFCSRYAPLELFQHRQVRDSGVSCRWAESCQSQAAQIQSLTGPARIGPSACPPPCTRPIHIHVHIHICTHTHTSPRLPLKTAYRLRRLRICQHVFRTTLVALLAARRRSLQHGIGAILVFGMAKNGLHRVCPVLVRKRRMTLHM
jgi:hypothetical protein